MALAKGKFRLSCDYPKAVYDELDRISKKTQEKNSKINKTYILNELLSAFVSLDDDTASELVSILKAKEQLHKTKAENSFGFIQQKEQETAKQYAKLSYIYSRFGETIPVIEDNGMKRYELNNGCVVVPKDWIAINPEVSKDHTYALVMEIKRDNQSYENNLYFIGFFDSQRIDSELEKRFIEEVKNIYINAKDLDAASIIGVFKIKEFNEKEPTGFYPYDAMIIRQK